MLHVSNVVSKSGIIERIATTFTTCSQQPDLPVCLQVTPFLLHVLSVYMQVVKSTVK